VLNLVVVLLLLLFGSAHRLPEVRIVRRLPDVAFYHLFSPCFHPCFVPILSSKLGRTARAEGEDEYVRPSVVGDRVAPQSLGSEYLWRRKRKSSKD
jgi:hypothetical protein